MTLVVFTNSAWFTIFFYFTSNIVLTIIYSNITSTNINNSEEYDRFYLYYSLFVVRDNFYSCNFQ